MNKKGFAVSVILYSIVFLIITTLIMLLGIVKTRYNVNDQLRKKIISEVDSEMDIGILFPSSESCHISANNTSGYTDNLVLTINVNNGSIYSWDNESFTTNNSTTVNRSGIYTGYFRDKVGGTGECSIKVLSRIQYNYRDCDKDNIIYGEWYVEESYGNTCTPIAKNTAESDNSDNYRVCNTGSGPSCSTYSPCYQIMTYKRNPTGCNWKDETWNGWTATFNAPSATRESKSATTYKVE